MRFQSLISETSKDNYISNRYIFYEILGSQGSDIKITTSWNVTPCTLVGENHTVYRNTPFCYRITAQE